MDLGNIDNARGLLDDLKELSLLLDGEQCACEVHNAGLQKKLMKETASAAGGMIDTIKAELSHL